MALEPEKWEMGDSPPSDCNEGCSVLCEARSREWLIKVGGGKWIENKEVRGLIIIVSLIRVLNTEEEEEEEEEGGE